MKLINFRKIGTVLAIAVFGFISFTAGVDLTQNANSTVSSSALPISKGGTGSNNAAGARANLGMTTTISSTSTDNEFPSSKTVYNNTGKKYTLRVYLNDTSSGQNYYEFTRIGNAVQLTFGSGITLPSTMEIKYNTKFFDVPEGYRPANGGFVRFPVICWSADANSLQQCKNNFSDNVIAGFFEYITSSKSINFFPMGFSSTASPSPVSVINTGTRYLSTSWVTEDSFPTQ
jgi:hypothetical protein